VVDDEINMKVMYKRVLSRWGYKVDVAGNSSEALELASKEKYDLMLIDIHIASSDGMELLTQLRELYPLTPAIIITGFPSNYSVNRSRELGVSDYLIKPLEIKELNSAIDRALNTVKV
jgi:DNA-binding response OmpR family regulator